MKSKFIMGLVMISMIIVSCKKFLTTESPSTFTASYVFSNITDAGRSVNAIYALFNTDAFTSRVANAFTANNDIEIGSISNAIPDGTRRDLWSFEGTSGNADLLTVWNNAYSAINKANESIEGIENSNLKNDPAMLQLKGEALALRAYWYYLLINNWGDVPFKTTPTRAGDDFYLPKTDRNVIFSSIIDDLVKIEPSMQWADKLDYGIERINREFVIGLIARISLQRGGYSLYPEMTMKRSADYLDYYKKANEYCRKLMTLKPHALDPQFSNVFLNECKSFKPLNSDVLYEVAFAPGSGDVGWATGIAVVGGPSHPYGTGAPNLTFTPSYYHSFDTLDVRLPATCSIISYSNVLQQTPVAVTAITPGKWNRILTPVALGTGSAKGTGINWPLMRYSDILLMLAESENEINGPNGDAVGALRTVRQRAFPTSVWAEKVTNYINTVSGSKQAFFDAIVNERAWEFGGEMLRKYDLIRWNYYGKKVAETRNILAQMGADAISGSGTYSNLPDVLYYKLNTTDKTCTFYNRYKKLLGGAPTGYTSINWLKGLYNTTSAGPADYVLRTWRGYTDYTGVTPLRYIYPIHSTIVTSSNGSIKNDGYGFTN